jgi:hypothetical protein
MLRRFALVFLCDVSPVPAEALATCYHNGQPVPEGTRIGSAVCANGQWVTRP